MNRWRGLDGWQLREFGNWPPTRRALACVLLGGLTLSVPWLALTRPDAARLSAQMDRASELHRKLAEIQQYAPETPILADLLPPPDQRPAPLELPELMADMAHLARTHGLHGAQFRPEREFARIGPWRGVRIAMRANGTWPQVAAFAGHLATPMHGNVVSLDNVQLRMRPDDPQAPAPSSPQLELHASVSIWQPDSGMPTPESNTFVDSIIPGGRQRNPFSPGQTAASALPANTLEQLPLSAFSMLGTLDVGQRRIGLLLTTDGQLHRVTSGTRLGRHQGRVTAVHRERIRITEHIPDGSGGWHERPTTIELNAGQATQATGGTHERN